MTIKKLTKIENGRLVPTDLSTDADLIEVSKEVGNELEVKEDGLFYKQPDTIYEDGLTEKESNRVGIEDYGIDLDKLKKLSSSVSAQEIDPQVLLSLEEHLSNLYTKIQLLKENPKTTTLYSTTGVASTSPKIFIGVAVANSNGDWSIDYSSVGFTQVPVVTISGQTVGTNTGDRRFASLGINQPTLTSCSGKLLSSSSAGLLAATTMITAGGNVNVIAIGY